MQPADLPLDIYRGDSQRLRVKLFTAATPPAPPPPLDLTGVVAKAEIRDRPAGTTIIALTCTITLPNIIDLQLTAADSHKLPVAGVWDLQLTFAGGEVKTPLAGQVRVTPDVTDSFIPPPPPPTP
jgi:hypothetical protein